MTDTLLQRLAEPFPPSAITWKPGSTKNGRCMALAYADLRAYQDKLDEVCGLDWSVSYQGWGDRIICHLTIAGVTRSATGEHNAQDVKNEMPGTVAEAQAFKRAAAMFGMGRYLYKLPSVWVDLDGKRIAKNERAALDKRYSDWYQRTMQKAAHVESDHSDDESELGAESEDLLGNDELVYTTDVDGPTNTGLHSEGSVDDIPGAREQRSNGSPIFDWRGPLDAQRWAVESGACANEYEARNSWKKIVMALGGYSKANAKDAFVAFHQRQQEKLREKVAA